MKIVTLTPGTGSFHCGSCIRDNSMVKAMREQGHDVMMVPLYLPFVTDGQDTSSGTPVFLGGINAYLQQKSKFFRVTPRWVDRILDNNTLLRKVSQNAGMTSPEDLGGITVSTLKGLEGFQKKEIDRLLSFLKNGEKPDAIIISNMLLTGLVPALKKEIGCKIIVTMQGEDTFLDSLPEPFLQQSWELIKSNSESADLFVAVSKYHADLMLKRLSLPKDKISVVYNGLDFTGYKKADYPIDPPVLGYLSRLIPEKGVHSLVDAFIKIKKQDLVPKLILKIAGSKTKSDAKFINSLREKIKSASIEDDVEFSFNLSREEKIDFLSSLSVFSVPAEYGESFGLYVIEAVAAGLPVVQPDSAAFPELLEELDCGLLYKTGDIDDLAAKIAEIVNHLDREKKRSLIAAELVNSKFTHSAMAEQILKLIFSN